MTNIYDIVIIGGGPAGLAAGIYASRARMKTLLLEKAVCGGQTLIADVVENFPGFPDGIRGPELAALILKQAKNFGVEIETAEAKNIVLKKGANPFKVVLTDGREIEAHSVIIATGARWTSLGIPGEKELVGKGVSYCATCDGPLFKNKDIVIIGGGDTAIEDALFLTKFANKVTVIHRRENLRATKILQERAFNNKKIEFCLASVASEIVGRNRVEAIKIKDVKTDKEKTLKTDGVFIFVGIAPNSEIVKEILQLDEKGYVISDDQMCTSVEGIFACGDVRKKTLRQVVTATGDGAQAAMSARKYVEHIKGIEYK